MGKKYGSIKTGLKMGVYRGWEGRGMENEGGWKGGGMGKEGDGKRGGIGIRNDDGECSNWESN